MTNPPKTKKELFTQLNDIVRHGKYEMPEKRYAGTGAPDLYLETSQDYLRGNKDIPDSIVLN